MYIQPASEYTAESVKTHYPLVNPNRTLECRDQHDQAYSVVAELKFAYGKACGTLPTFYCITRLDTAFAACIYGLDSSKDALPFVSC